MSLIKNIASFFNRGFMLKVGIAVDQVLAKWSWRVYTLLKLVLSMFALVISVGAMVILTEFFIDQFGIITFVFVLIVSSFIFSVSSVLGTGSK